MRRKGGLIVQESGMIESDVQGSREKKAREVEQSAQYRRSKQSPEETGAQASRTR